MNLVFCHDHKFRFDGKSYYSNGSLSNEVLSWYVDLADNLTVVARVIEMDDSIEHLSQITNQNITIVDRSKLEQAIENADAVICRLPSFVGNKAFKLSKKFNKKCLIELVGCPLESYWYHSFKGKAVAVPIFLQTRKIVRSAEWVSYVTENFLQKRYPNKMKCLACSDVALPKQKLDIGQISIREQKLNVAFQERRYHIGTIGALNVKYKGQQDVIKAIAALNKVGIFLDYDLVGVGDSMVLMELAGKYSVEKQVHPIGILPHEKIFEWLSTLDIYIQPSYTEGMPRSVIEALSIPCLVMGSRVGEIPSLIDNRYVFQPGKYAEIVEIIKSLNKNDLKSLKENKERALEFEKNLLDKRRISYYREFIGSE
ncbi:MAG: glycosyltransferase [Clostridiaceae bacterium]|nr:glycosyltransferase [Clostridiaceae bacterium]